MKERGENFLPGIGRGALEEFLAKRGEAKFRARQIFSWLYDRCVFDPAEMKNLPLTLREKLRDTFAAPRSSVAESVSGSGGTEKLLVRLDDGEMIEMVLIPAPGRMTFCLSTQVGCPVRCRFCASGRDGLVRSLRCDEMLEEFYHGVRRWGRLPDNLVFMGIGEGLLNFEHLAAVLNVLSAPSPDGFAMSPRRITVSTSGFVPGMRKFAEWGRPFNLAISLHAVDDATRARLIPDHCRYPLAEILAAAELYRERSGRMVTFEYTLAAGINDDPAMGRQLGMLAAQHHAKVNLIACNPVEGSDLRRPEPAVLEAFQRAVEEHCASVTMRVEKGGSAASACGQLRSRRKDAEQVPQDGALNHEILPEN